MHGFLVHTTRLLPLFLKVVDIYFLVNNLWLFLESKMGHSNSGGPGIEGFQIIGEATPGEKLLGCGYPVRGTTLCMFQVKN